MRQVTQVSNTTQVAQVSNTSKGITYLYPSIATVSSDDLVWNHLHDKEYGIICMTKSMESSA
jgi:hypothetical protein